MIQALIKSKPVHRAIMVTDFLFGLSRGLVIPFLISDMKYRLGASYSALAGGVLIYFLARVIGGPFGGYLSDIFGRKHLVVFSSLLTSILYIALAFVKTIDEFFILKRFSHYPGVRQRFVRNWHLGVPSENGKCSTLMTFSCWNPPSPS